MFEVEKKVSLSVNQLNDLKKRSSFIKKQTIEDIYYDNDEYLLTLSNKWLRKRNNTFELKIGPKFNQEVNHYEEITKEEEIKETLQFDSSLSLPISLSRAGIFPFCSFVTHREKYQLDEFIIDLDIADFGDFTYQVAEIELLVSKKEEMVEAEEKIQKKLLDLNIISKDPVMAKLSYFLMKKRPDHYETLINSKVIV